MPIIEDTEQHVPSKGWAEMIRKVYEVDPLLCPQCGGDRIISHLKLTFHAERTPPPQVVQQELLIAAKGREEYF